MLTLQNLSVSFKRLVNIDHSLMVDSWVMGGGQTKSSQQTQKSPFLLNKHSWKSIPDLYQLLQWASQSQQTSTAECAQKKTILDIIPGIIVLGHSFHCGGVITKTLQSWEWHSIWRKPTPKASIGWALFHKNMDRVLSVRGLCGSTLPGKRETMGGAKASAQSWLCILTATGMQYGMTGNFHFTA